MKKKWNNLSKIKKIAFIIGVVIISIVVIALINESSKPKILSDSETAQQLDRTITAKMLTENPKAYQNKVVELTGRVFNTDKEGKDIAWQVWTDADKSEGNVILYYPGSSDIGNDDYVKFTGQVGGVFEGENAFGANINAPTIYVKSISKISRDEAVAPAIKTIAPNESQGQEGLTINLDRVEFADNETRVYVTVTNNSSSKASFYTFNAKLIQDTSQIKSKTIFEDNDEIPSDIPAKTKESGKLYFEKADPSKPLAISFEAYTEANYKQLTYTFNVKE